MTLQWREDLPTDWENAPDHPPEADSEYIIESLGNGIIMLPLDASVDEVNTQSYLYCDEGNVAALGEKMA